MEMSWFPDCNKKIDPKKNLDQRIVISNPTFCDPTSPCLNTCRHVLWPPKLLQMLLGSMGDWENTPIKPIFSQSPLGVQLTKIKDF